MENCINIKSKTYSQLTELIGKKVRFISDCELVPNFDVIVTVMDIRIDKGSREILFDTKRTNGKKLTIGSNMKNLRYCI